MILQLSDLLAPADAATLAAALAASPDFRDGAKTAGRFARPRKNNLQAREGGAVEAALDRVHDALLGHPVVRSAARPRTVVRLLANRYDAGMAYGTHVDDAIIDGERTDVSFTLFLSPLDAYDGGALVLEDDGSEREYRLPPGAALLYPSTRLHRVAPVTRGTRLAVVGWIRSWVADAAAREILFDLDRVADALAGTPGCAGALDRVQRVRANLMRRWAR
jgi:PKHD-type hydroxylase